MIMLGTGKSVVKALEVLKQHSVDGKKVIVLTLFATPESKSISSCVCARVRLVLSVKFAFNLLFTKTVLRHCQLVPNLR